MKKKSPSEKWGEEKFHFDYQKEFSIYRYLYRSNRTKLEKIENKYDTYEAWKTHVRESCKGIDCKEFRRFLICRERKSTVNIELIHSVLNTFVVGTLTGLIMTTCTFSFNESKLKGMALGINSLLIMVILVLLLLGAIYIVFKPTLEEAYAGADHKAFYEDYLEIVEEIIQEQSKETKQLLEGRELDNKYKKDKDKKKHNKHSKHRKR